MAELDVLRDPRWLPMGIDADAARVRFVRADDALVRDATFLGAGFARDLPSAELDAAAVRSATLDDHPASWIWHTAFCRSTLLARALDHPGACRALREPALLMDLANLQRVPPRHGPLDPALRDAAFALLARRVQPAERVLVKPTNAANNLLAPLLAARPADRVLLLHSSLEDFLLSLARKGQQGATFVRHLLKVLLLDAGGSGLPPQQLLELTDLQVVALTWRVQLEALARAAAPHPDRVRVLDSTRLLTAPQATLRAAAEWLALPLDAATRAAIVAGPVFAHDAKGTRGAYDLDAYAAERSAARAALGPDLELVLEWSRGLSHGPPPLATLPALA